MSDSSPEKREPSPWRIVPAPSINFGTIHVDCSSWDAEDGEVPGPSQPPQSAAVNYGTIVLEFIESKSIEIVMNVADCESKEAAFQLALDMIYSVTQSAPDLKLLYDPDRTRQEVGQVTIVLTPQVYLKDDAKLKELIERISGPTIGPGKVPGPSIADVRIVAAAA